MKLLHAKRPAPNWRVVLEYVKAGHTIIGIDEVGRGAWAGPVVAAAVILPPRARILGLADSKLLSPAQRVSLSRVIKRTALAIGIGWVSSNVIDSIGLTEAVRRSGLLAIEGLGDVAGEPMIILDGKHNYLASTHSSITFVKADARIVPVSAASVIAKVARDSYMAHLAKRSPGYGFEIHKGYGTKSHQFALQELGPSSYHRVSWSPFGASISK